MPMGVHDKPLVSTDMGMILSTADKPLPTVLTTPPAVLATPLAALATLRTTLPRKWSSSSSSAKYNAYSKLCKPSFSNSEDSYIS